MNKYIVKSGQNIYDVALAIYGSIEGVFDLLASNPKISFNTTFYRGIELNYHEDFVINQDIVSWFDTNNMTIKNGKYEINNIDIKTQIINWIDNSNKSISEKYQSGELKKIEYTSIKPNPNFDWDWSAWEESDDIPVSSKSKSKAARATVKASQEWDVAADNIKYFSVSDDIIDFASKISNIDLSQMADDNISDNLRTMFINGMIVIPSNENEKEIYYNTISAPKILLIQTGRNVTINMQIKNGSLAVIDWGDGTPLNFYHYQDVVASAIHTYEDSNEHTITIYGCSKFINLDFTQANSVYYALSEIYIDNQFETPYPNATALNKLFIKKASNE